MNQLVQYIKQHGIEAYSFDGKIIGMAQYSYNGRSYTKREVIKPTIKAVREWLGY